MKEKVFVNILRKALRTVLQYSFVFLKYCFKFHRLNLVLMWTGSSKTEVLIATLNYISLYSHIL